MLIYFLGGEKYSGMQIEQSIPPDFGKVQAFSKIGEFTRALKNKNPGLIFADHNFMRGNFFNIKDFCSEQKIPCPLVLFNTPWAKGGSEEDFYLYQLSPFIQEHERAQYKKIITHFCGRMQKPGGQEADGYLSKLKLETKMSERLYETARFILENKDGVSLEEIRAHLSAGKKNVSENGANIIMTRLKKVCRTDGGCGMNLCRENGKYLFRFF